MTIDAEFGPDDYMNAGIAFAEACAELQTKFPTRHDTLEDTMIFVATELWDKGFSQTEIKAAFDSAVSELALYAIRERR